MHDVQPACLFDLSGHDRSDGWGAVRGRSPHMCAPPETGGGAARLVGRAVAAGALGMLPRRPPPHIRYLTRMGLCEAVRLAPCMRHASSPVDHKIRVRLPLPFPSAASIFHPRLVAKTYNRGKGALKAKFFRLSNLCISARFSCSTCCVA